MDMNITGNKNPTVHVYMSEDEDLWFFQELAGGRDMLRKHTDIDDVDVDVDVGFVNKSPEEIQDDVEKELNQAIREEEEENMDNGDNGVKQEE